MKRAGRRARVRRDRVGRVGCPVAVAGRRARRDHADLGGAAARGDRRGARSGDRGSGGRRLRCGRSPIRGDRGCSSLRHPARCGHGRRRGNGRPAGVCDGRGARGNAGHRGSWTRRGRCVDLYRPRAPASRRLPQHVMRDERGTALLWVLGLCVAVLFLGGLGLDLWRGIAVRRELSAMADSAATAAANGVDEERLRAGEVILDPLRVEAIAAETLGRDERARAARRRFRPRRRRSRRRDARRRRAVLAPRHLREGRSVHGPGDGGSGA